MRFIFTCGGTAGHINPAIAVANEIKRRYPESEFLFVGAEGKMETRLVPREGYEIKTVRVMNLSRSKSLAGLKHNAAAAAELVKSLHEAGKIVDGFKPDAVIGTGGYVCYPVIHEASRRGIPTALHESNAAPGLTTRMLEKQTDLIMVGFEESKAGYKDKSKVVVTGTPVRGAFFELDRETAKKKLGVGDRPLVVSFWGSLGAEHMNDMTAELIRLNCGAKAFYHIHATGGGETGERTMREKLTALGAEAPESCGTEVRGYIYDMPEVMAAADLILCRAGASTLGELTALGRPAVLIPSPFVVNDHQTANARVLERRGGSLLIPQSECSGQKLFDTAVELLNDRRRLAEMERRQRDESGRTAAGRIADMILTQLLRIKTGG